MFAKRQYITIAAFLSLAINGLTFTFLGTSLPAVQSYLDISIDRATLLVALFQGGYTVCSLVSGILSDSFRRERILMLGCLLLGTGSLFFCTVSSFAINAIITLLMGTGIGCILSGSNTLLVSLYPEKKGAILNIHHIFFGLGSLLGPLIIGYLIAHNFGWRQGYIAESIILFTLALLFFFAGGRLPKRNRKTSLLNQVVKLSLDKKFQIILVVNGLAVGTQITIMILGVTYLLDAKGCNLATAGIAISLFSITMMMGRLICSRLMSTFRHTTIIMILLWLQLFTLLLVWLGEPSLAVAAVAISGFAFSGIYPTSLALTGIFFPQITGSALGILSTIGGLGSLVISWLVGIIAGLTDMQSGFIVIILASMAALGLFLLNYRSLCRREETLTLESVSPQPYRK